MVVHRLVRRDRAVGGGRDPGRVHTNRSGARLTWWLLAAGQLLFVVGDLLFDLHERVWQTDAFPSAADGFYLAGYLPLATGVVLLIRARPRDGTGPA
jgi:hypothetical protein